MSNVDDLLDQLDKTAEGWRPQAGDKIAGKVVARYGRDGSYGPYEVLEIATTTGRLVAVHCFHTVLRNELESRNPQIGDTVGVKYEGRKAGKGGSEYESYKIAVQPAQPGIVRPAAAPSAPLAPAADVPDIDDL